MTTEPTFDPVKAAKAMHMLAEGYTPWHSMKDRFRVNGPYTGTLIAEVVGSTPLDGLAAAYDVLYPGKEPGYVVVKAVPPGFFWIMGNTLYLKGSQSGRTVDGDGYLVFMGGADILHDLKPLFGEVRPR